jgi:nicotinate-nucleotide adenylyltransferase
MDKCEGSSGIMMAEAVGIMGGTFDPIHFGHLLAAEEARFRLALDRVVFVPNGEPPHKKDYSVSSGVRRYEMVVLATASNPAFEASRLEVERRGPSYAVDTLRELRGELGRETKLYFITGADAVLELLSWRSPEKLVELCEFVAVTRPGYDLERLGKRLSAELPACVHVLDVPGVHISSTELRRRAAAGESLRYLTPSSVVRYIAAHGLYSGGESGAG